MVENEWWNIVIFNEAYFFHVFLHFVFREVPFFLGGAEERKNVNFASRIIRKNV